MALRDIYSRIFVTDKHLTNRDYERGRMFFLFEGSAAGGVFALTSGAFLAGFAKYMGASDEFNGIIGAIPALAGIIQMFSSLVFEKIIYRKFLVAISCLMYRVLLGLMLFIPMLVKDNGIRVLLLAVIYFLAYSIASFITPPASMWIADLSPDSIRGRYLAKKDAISLAFVTIVTLIMGWVMDYFKGINNEYGGFVLLGVIVIIMAFSNFIFLSSIHEPVINRKTFDIKLKEVFTMAFRHKGFRKVITMSVMWNVAFQIGGPFITVYFVTDIKLSYSYLMVMGLVGSITRVLVARVWGKYADKKSWFFVTKYSLVTLAVTHTLIGFVDIRTAPILVPIINFLAGIAWAGIVISMFNIQFLYAPEHGKTVYLGTSAALGGLAGFLSALLGAFIIRIFSGVKVNLGIISIGNMQIAFILSGILILLTALYVSRFMEKSYGTVHD
ncbi:MAG: MFS transporter [Bacillota bacterium]|nr:MFS transporter [Bacillota bacterium]